MFFFFNKKKQESKPDRTPVWFKWLLGGFLVYAIAYNVFSPKTPTQPAETTNTERLDFRPVAGVIGKPEPFHFRDTITGSGTVAGCGDSVRFHYSLHRSDQNLVETVGSKEQPVATTLGKNAVFPALERSLLGMKEGGQRLVVASPAQAFAATGFRHPAFGFHDTVGIKLWLDAVEPFQPSVPQHFGYRQFDVSAGEGRPAVCTDDVEMQVTLWSVRGERLWSTQSESPASPETQQRDYITVRIGEGKWPYAVEKMLMGMRRGGKRTALVPMEWMAMPEGSNIPNPFTTLETFHLPPDEIVIMDITLRGIHDLES